MSMKCPLMSQDTYLRLFPSKFLIFLQYVNADVEISELS